MGSYRSRSYRALGYTSIALGCIILVLVVAGLFVTVKTQYQLRDHISSSPVSPSGQLPAPGSASQYDLSAYQRALSRAREEKAELKKQLQAVLSQSASNNNSKNPGRGKGNNNGKGKGSSSSGGQCSGTIDESAVAENGCIYTDPSVIEIATLAEEFYTCALFHNFEFNMMGGGSVESLNNCYWDFSVTPLSVNTGYQKVLALNAKLEAANSNPLLKTTEKIRLNFVKNEVELVLKLVELGYFHEAHGHYWVDYAWYEDPVVQIGDTVNILLGADLSFEASYDTKVLEFVKIAAPTISQWTTILQNGVAAGKMHAGIVMEFQSWAYDESTVVNFADLCPTLQSTTAQTECLTYATAANAAMDAYRAYFLNTYVPTCLAQRPNNKAGLGQQPDGKAMYDAWLLYHLGYVESQQTVYDLGVQRTADNRQGILDLVSSLDPSITTFAQASASLANASDTRWYICSEDPKDVIDYVRSISLDIEDSVLSLFGQLSPVRPSIMVEGSPSTYAVSGYYDALTNMWLDPPIYNIGQLTGCQTASGAIVPYYDRLQMGIVAHEAMPGHGLQLQLEAQVDCGIGGMFAVGPTQYYEGWGLYSENLPYMMGDGPKGLYTDPINELSFFTGTMLRNVRLLVDGGMHANYSGAPYLSYEDCIAKMVENAFSTAFAESECERYIAMPGQATAYMLGNIRFLELSQNTQTALGALFDYREFHAVLLRWGGMSFDELTALVDTYVAWKKAANPLSTTLDNLFGIDLIRNELFSRFLPSVGCGRYKDATTSILSAKSATASDAKKSGKAKPDLRPNVRAADQGRPFGRDKQLGIKKPKRS